MNENFDSVQHIGTQAQAPARVVGMWTWLGRSLLLAIPVVRLVLCVKWGFNRNGDSELRNFALANLIIIAIGYALLIIFLYILYLTSFSLFQDLIDY